MAFHDGMSLAGPRERAALLARRARLERAEAEDELARGDLRALSRRDDAERRELFWRMRAISREA